MRTFVKALASQDLALTSVLRQLQCEVRSTVNTSDAERTRTLAQLESKVLQGWDERCATASGGGSSRLGARDCLDSQDAETIVERTHAIVQVYYSVPQREFTTGERAPFFEVLGSFGSNLALCLGASAITGAEILEALLILILSLPFFFAQVSLPWIRSSTRGEVEASRQSFGKEERPGLDETDQATLSHLAKIARSKESVGGEQRKLSPPEASPGTAPAQVTLGEEEVLPTTGQPAQPTQREYGDEDQRGDSTSLTGGDAPQRDGDMLKDGGQRMTRMWVAYVDNESNRTYYYNHASKETTWKPPEQLSQQLSQQAQGTATAALTTCPAAAVADQAGEVIRRNGCRLEDHDSAVTGGEQGASRIQVAEAAELHERQARWRQQLLRDVEKDKEYEKNAGETTDVEGRSPPKVDVETGGWSLVVDSLSRHPAPTQGQPEAGPQNAATTSMGVSSALAARWYGI